MSKTPGWDEVKRFPRVGDLVAGAVLRRAPFGVFVEIDGVPFDGLVKITDFRDEGRMTADEFPPVGASITARVLGFKETSHQIWLGVKPSQLGALDQPGEDPGTKGPS